MRRIKNRSKGTRCTQYSDEILSIFGIDIVEDTDHATINCLKKRLLGLRSKEEQLRVLAVSLVKEHAHDTSLPQADAIFNEKQNVTVCLSLIHI